MKISDSSHLPQNVADADFQKVLMVSIGAYSHFKKLLDSRKLD